MPELKLPAPPLADEAIALRQWRDGDVAAIVRMADDEESARFTRVPSPYTEQDALEFLSLHEPARREGRALYLAIVSRAGGEVLGSVDLRVTDWEHRVGEIGYMVTPAARGRGVATRAVRLLGSWGFEHAGLDRIEIYAQPENAASVRVIEKAGYEREGLLRKARFQRGRRVDLILFARVREGA